MTQDSIGQAGTLSRDDLRSILPEGRDEQFNRFVRFFKERREEWYKRPFIDGMPKVKDYIDGHVGLSVWRKVVGETYDVRTYKLVVDKGNRPPRAGERRLPDLGVLGVDDKHVVLVPIIDLPREPQDFVAVPVGSQLIQNEGVGPRDGFLNRSVLKGTYHFLPDLGARKGTLLGLGINHALEAHPAAIQGRAEAENRVSCEKGNRRRDDFPTEHDLSVIRLRADERGLILPLNEFVDPLSDLADLTLGPLDF